MAKKVIYLGLERCDFIYHLTLSLGSMYRVLVYDNSLSGDLFSSVNKGTDEIYSWLKMDFVRNISAGQDSDSYDYIIVYAGNRMEKEYLSYMDALFLLMPQCSWQGLQNFKDNGISLDKTDHILIIRDYFSKGMTTKSLGTLLEISPNEIDGFVANSAEDYGAYLSLTYSGRQGSKHLSSDMQEALIYVLSTLNETDRKTAQLMLKHSWGILKKQQRQVDKQAKREAKTAGKEKKHGNFN